MMFEIFRCYIHFLMKCIVNNSANFDFCSLSEMSPVMLSSKFLLTSKYHYG